MSAQGGLLGFVDQAASRFEALLRDTEGATPLDEVDWLAEAERQGALRRPLAWRNLVVETPGFARLHVEFFAIPGEIAVLHLCGFPRLDVALPIFGFDIVSGREKATGCFLDLSPTVPEATPLLQQWAARARLAAPGLGEPRELPSWAWMFSCNAIAVRPRGQADVDAALRFGEAMLCWLLGLGSAEIAEPQAMRVAQLRYIDGQRRNDRTRRMLAGCIGNELADRFIAEVLFPDPAALPSRRLRATEAVP